MNIIWPSKIKIKLDWEHVGQRFGVDSGDLVKFAVFGKAYIPEKQYNYVLNFSI